MINLKNYFRLSFFLFIFVGSPELRADPTMADNLASPFTTDAKYVLYTGTLATLTLLYFEDQVIDPTQAETTEDKPMGKYSRFFDYGGMGIPNALYFLGMGTAYLFSGNRYYGARSALMFRSTLYSGAVITVLKYTIREPRPNNPQEKNSFPSGHSGMAFAFASTIGMTHSWFSGLLAYTYAAGVAYSRINDNRHYLHDVVAGATIGMSYGIALAQKGRRFASNSTFQLLPSDDLSGLKIAYLHQF